MVEQGRVTINGKRPSNGQRVKKRDKVKVDGRLVSEEAEDDVYLAFNKPTGIVSTTDTQSEPNNIVDYIAYPRRIFPVGRLDKASEGLIFMTGDGDIVNKILRAGNHHEKEYQVWVDKVINADFIKKMGSGIPIMGTTTRKCEVEQLTKNSFRIVLTQGLNRQIRRMCEYLGYEAIRLKRTRIMNVKLDVAEGEWRDLTAHELREINAMIASSTKTQKKTGASHTSQKKKPKQGSKPPQKSKPKLRSSGPSKRGSGPKKSKNSGKRQSSKGRRR